MTEYDDIIDLPRPKSKHEPMPMSDRAAQFSPFAALTGYGDAIDETARLTDHRIGLTLYRLNDVLEGDLDEIITALTLAEQTALMEKQQ